MTCCQASEKVNYYNYTLDNTLDKWEKFSIGTFQTVSKNN
jgi:hypothetical protein